MNGKKPFRAGVALATCVLPLIALLGLFLILSLGFSNLSYADEINEDSDHHATGLILMTPQEREAFRKTHGKVKEVLPNRIALERVNKTRVKKGLSPLYEEGVARGKEIISSMGGRPGAKPPASDVSPLESDLLPPDIDNSELQAFPVIRTQGSLGSCASFATTYYQLTHMAGLMHGWDNKNENNDTKFSPRWTYNFVNGGENAGSQFSSNYNVLVKHGAATWFDFPYDGIDYRQWCLDTSAWENAINYRANPVEYADVDDKNPAPGLEQIKQLLVDGYVVTFGTYIYSWQFTNIKDDPSTPEDDAFVGKEVAYWVRGTQGAHAMTIVGYNDTIWTDINGNRKVDEGEKGALRIANSWGDDWKDSGFTWLAYDALKSKSSIKGAPRPKRVGAIITKMVYVITVKYPYAPKMVAEFTVVHAKRNQLRMSLGISDTDVEIPSITWYPGAINLQGGPYAFDGTTVACDGTFVFDFTDILSGVSEKRYYLGMYDRTAGDQAELYSFEIKDILNGGYWPATYLPSPVDDGQVYAYLDYEFIDNPVAVVSAEPISGTVPLTISFDGSGSYDPDGGDIVTYAWDFGDGSAHTGEIVEHTYNTAGTFNAKLTVTDDEGVSSFDAVTITAEPSSVQEMHVSDIAMSLKTRGVFANAVAMVTIFDAGSQPVQGATVYGIWSGLTSDSDSGITDSSGQVSLSSDKVKKANGTFTFTVDDVVLDGWTYDSGNNVETSDSISTP